MSKRHSDHKLSFTIWFLLVIIILAGCINFFRPLPVIVADTTPLASQTTQVTLNWPADGSSSAFGATGYGVLSTDGNSRLPTASIAKLITILTVLNKYPLRQGQSGPTLTFTSSDVDIYNNYVDESGSVVPVQAGEQLTEYQAIQAMLLPSANNIADSLAIWAFGSLQNYQVNATLEVHRLGLEDTVVGTDASGFSPTTQSSPSDLVKLGIAVLGNPVLAQIVNQPSTVLPVAGTIYNVNSMLGVDGINGIKTGNSDQAGGNFLFSAPITIDGLSTTIVGIIMHAPTLASALSESPALLDSITNGFKLQTPVKAGQLFGSYTAEWGSSSAIVAKNNVSLLSWDGTTVKSAISLRQLSRPENPGTRVGSIVINSGSYSVTGALVLKQGIEAPSFWWRLTRH